MARVKREHPGHSHGGTCWRTRAVLKKHLSDDFNRRCAYCDDRDFYCGGINSFHIDHFAPKSKFPKLEFQVNESNFFFSKFKCCMECKRKSTSHIRF